MSLENIPFCENIEPAGFDSFGLLSLIKNLSPTEQIKSRVVAVTQNCLNALERHPQLCRKLITQQDPLAEKALTYLIAKELASVGLQNSASIVVNNPHWWYPYFFSGYKKRTLLKPTDN